MADCKTDERKKAKEEKAKLRSEMKTMFSPRHYVLLMIVCAILRMRFRARSKLSPAFREQKRKGAMLVLSNHVSAMDFSYFTTTFLGKKVSFVVAENMMYSTPIFATMIQGYHAITKKQFFADYTCIKNIKKYLDHGISVILCPEGKVSAEGKTGPMLASIARLVKWLGYPVASSVICGGGIARPKWAHTGRTGKVVCHMDIMMTQEEVNSMTPAQIMERIETSLDHNEHVWQIENKVKFRGKRFAEGLERLLYRCPDCGEEFSMRTKDDEIFCEKCGFRARYTHYGKLEKVNGNRCPERIDLWFDEEKDAVRKQVSEPGFEICKPVCLFLENANKNGYRFVTAGKLTLDKDNLTFEADGDYRPKNVDSKYKIGEMDFTSPVEGVETEPVEEEFKHMVFPIKNFVTIANIPGDSLDLYDEKHTYRMMFSKEKASTKYVLSIEEINDTLGRIKK